MENKDYLKKVYKNFSDFVAVASARELEYFILDANFTSSFNTRMKQVMDDIRMSGKGSVDFSIMFNTHGEIAIIDANLVGRFIGNNYNIHIQNYYKSTTLNRVVRQVINGSEKNQKDFIIVSYSILYHTMKEIYSEIICRKDIIRKYKLYYLIENYDKEDQAAVIACMLVLEDICRYMGIPGEYLLQCIHKMVTTENCNEN